MNPDWLALEANFPLHAVRFLRERIENTPGSFSVTATRLAADTGAGSTEVESLLETLVDRGLLTKRAYVRCAQCGIDLSDGAADECAGCGTAFVDQQPVSEVRYQLDRQPPRDVPWVLVLHGMNTRGTWQEELTWLIARSYKRMVPVAIYKYGAVRPGVLFAWRQRMIMNQIIDKYVALSKQARDAGLHGPPDVIAHSFGTWLIAHALSDSRMRIGRLILLGSIVRPDFPWRRLIEEQKVDMVLNHGATKDFWVTVAQFGIPDSGPGGRMGYASPVRNIAAEGLGHSDYFDPEERMRELFGTVWQPFLSWNGDPPLPAAFNATPWRPVALPIRYLTRLVVIVAFGSILGGLGLTLAYGFSCLIR